jgi:hypothetical protein
MPRPTLDELYRRHGMQQAAYLTDYLAERGGHLIACVRCGRLCVADSKPTRRERDIWRCGECLPREKTDMEARG